MQRLQEGPIGISVRCTRDYETDGGPQWTMWTHLAPYTITRLLQVAKAHDELIEFAGRRGLAAAHALNRGEDPDQSPLLLLFQATDVRDDIINCHARDSLDRFHLALALGD